MNNPTEPDRWLNDLNRVAQIRQQMAVHLQQMAETLTQAELNGERLSGKLGLDREIQTVTAASENLRQGVFRLLVLGDMKRGKSTFLNALLGENLLPSDVSPCTALLTVLKYGPEKQVTVYFTDGTPPEPIDFETFKQRYTIPPEAAQAIEQREQLVFPNVSHAVVEHPLPLLGQGIELVDTPGLNDIEARNELSLGYIYNCHAILFVLGATQPCTLEERRYLNNYLKERGLTIFFLINGWDQVRSSLVDPGDPIALQAAETKLRQVFRTNLTAYCHEEGIDRYSQRVFELSSLNALRTRSKYPDASLAGTGFPEFSAALNQFLTHDRAFAAFHHARTNARRSYHSAQSAIARRIPLLDQSVEEIQQKVVSVQADFEQLANSSSKKFARRENRNLRRSLILFAPILWS
jgi:GTPase SAR1 family protein